MPQVCLICGEPVSGARGLDNEPYKVRRDCERCGSYVISERAAQQLHEMTRGMPLKEALPDWHLIAGAVREQFELRGEAALIDSSEQLLSSAHSHTDPLASVDRILLYAQRKADRLGDEVTFHPARDFPLAYAKDAIEFNHFLRLALEIGYVEIPRPGVVRLKPDGWRRLNELRANLVDRNSAFVAMSFSDDLRRAFNDGIKAALSDAGYEAVRVDLIEYNGKIDDRVIADIRKSSLMVADFSEHRQNVYFEAGFALGLGRQVIWTCRESDIGQAHFDTRQYNHIVWRDVAELRERLRQRIEATIPDRGH